MELSQETREEMEKCITHARKVLLSAINDIDKDKSQKEIGQRIFATYSTFTDILLGSVLPEESRGAMKQDILISVLTKEMGLDKVEKSAINDENLTDEEREKILEKIKEIR